MNAAYEDNELLEATLAKLKSLPPLVTSFEIDRLRSHLAEAEEGNRFVLQGGDCAETLAECQPGIITNKVKILLQMSMVLLHATKRPVLRIGRLAGQYAKPRSSAVEKRDGMELPSYFGDLLNDAVFDTDARRLDPSRLVSAYQHAALTLNFIRSLSDSGFADLHHPEYWDLSFIRRAGLNDDLRRKYEKLIAGVAEALRFMEALSENSVEELSRVEFFTSHEGLNLYYEEAQTRTVPRREGYYNLTTHLPWIGERTRNLDGAHIEYFRGIKNPIGVKLGPTATGDDALKLLDALNPNNETGKILLVVRMGADKVEMGLPHLVKAVQREGRHVLWMSDPMHGNTQSTASGIKTRRFENILNEVKRSFDVHESLGSRLGGVHFELTGDDVTECIGAGISEEDLTQNYASLCDPRLNYAQALEMAFSLAGRLEAK